MPKLNDTGDAPITQYVCIDVPDTQVSSVEDAVAAWSKALFQWKRLVSVVGKPDVIKCDYTVQQTDDVNMDDDAAMAWASMIGGRTVLLTRGRYEEDTIGIVLHEMGHLLGAQHVAGTLMNATYNKGMVCPDVTTVAQVAAWNRVNLRLLGWCQQ